MHNKKTFTEYARIRRSRLRLLGLCLCGKKPLPYLKWCGSCRDYATKIGRAKNNRERQRAIDAYGGRCTCCGESEPRFLQLDHVNDDGYKHRKEMKTNSLARWAIKNNFPPSLQLLCANCNHAKRFGLCPHQSTSVPKETLLNAEQC